MQKVKLVIWTSENISKQLFPFSLLSTDGLADQSEACLGLCLNLIPPSNFQGKWLHLEIKVFKLLQKMQFKKTNEIFFEKNPDSDIWPLLWKRWPSKGSGRKWVIRPCYLARPWLMLYLSESTQGKRWYPQSCIAKSSVAIQLQAATLICVIGLCSKDQHLHGIKSQKEPSLPV